MTILIIIGKIILWLIGGIVISLIIGLLHDFLKPKDGGIDHGIYMIVGFIITFILYCIGTAIYFFIT